MPTTQIIDVGTGTGAIAISLKLARPDLAIRALDLSPKTLAVAKNNADRLHAGEIIFAQGDLLSNVTLSSPSCIVANLPYVDPQWERSPETAFEPPLALFAKDGGLALIYKLIGQSAVLQSTGDYLALEADPVQHSRIIQTATAAGYALHKAQEYALLFQKC